MRAKLEKINQLLDEAIKKIDLGAIKKIDLGMPFTAHTDAKDAQQLVREVLAEEFPDKYSRDNW